MSLRMTVSGKQWADGPFELLPTSIMGHKPDDKPPSCHAIAQDMIMVHNLLLRGINSIYLQCVNVELKSPESIPDFVNYAQQWGLCIREHHDIEEEFFFPEIERFAGAEGIMAANVAQHAAFHDGLGAYVAYVDAVKAGEEEYGGERLRGLIDAFLPVLREHLRDEITTLVALDRYEDRGDWAAWMKTTQAAIMKKTSNADSKYTTLPLILCNHDRTFEDGKFAGWLSLPWVANLLVKWVFAPKHKTWWRFAPCDVSGKPRELVFAD